MPCHPRAAPGGYFYLALDRCASRLPLFRYDGDFDAFERVISDWTELLRWMKYTHAQRCPAQYNTA